MTKFRIHLQKAHEKYGKTAYAVAKELGLNQGTVRKYATEDVVSDWMPAHVISLAKCYGYDWWDPEIVEIIEEDEESTGQIKTLLAPA